MRQEQVINMNIQSSIEKALKNEKVGNILGALLAENAYGKPRGWSWYQNIDGQLHHLWTEPHFPDLNSVRYDLTGAGPLSEPFKGAVMAVIAGEIGKELNIHPKVTQISKVASNLGVNVGIGLVAVALVERSSLQHSPTPSPSGGYGHSSENPMEGVYNL